MTKKDVYYFVLNFFQQEKGFCAEIMSVTLNLSPSPVFNCVRLFPRILKRFRRLEEKIYFLKTF